MTDLTSNKAAWQRATGQPLEIAQSDLSRPGQGQILICNSAIAINPLDWLLQDNALLPWLDYPAVLGSDTAGVVAAVGPAVIRFKVGDRVLGQAVGTTTNNPAEGTYQHYTLVSEHMASPIPDTLEFTDAAVLPLGLGTAAVGLYGKEHLALAAPSLTPPPKDEVVLIWGGSSSVGCNAVQLARASGYVVIATASAHNADMLKGLGASQVFDYAHPGIVQEIVAGLNGKRLAGVIHATGNIHHTLAVAAQCDGMRKVAVTLPPPKELPHGVTATHIIGPSLKDDEVGPMIYRDFLPAALSAGQFLTAPPARVTGHGLESIQNAVETLKAGVSAAKIVVTLN